MNTELVRSLVPQSCLQDFDDIVTGRSLGASNHIKMISNMYKIVAKQYPAQDAKQAIEKISAYFKETRGNSSYAIITALNRIEYLIDQSSQCDYSIAVEEAVNQYFINANDDMQRVLKYTDRLLKDIQTIMILIIPVQLRRQL